MSPLLPIERTSDTPIRPKDIDGDSAFIGAFGKKEQEVLALWVVRLCQTKHSWRPFKITDLANYFILHSGVSFTDSDQVMGLIDGFEGSLELLSDWVLVENGVVTLTTAFVARCYMHAPVLGMPLKKRVRKPKVDNRISRYDRLLKPCF